MRKILNFILMLCLVLYAPLNASELRKSLEEPEFVQVAGIVVNAGNLDPLENVTVYDESGKIIGKTDVKGYFTGKVKYSGKEAIQFKIKIEKSGYKSFIQKENWGNLENGTSCMYYIGLEKKDGSNSDKAFSEMILQKDISYNSVLSGFVAVKEKQQFNRKIEELKKDNQHVFFEINHEYYLINNGGWLKISSSEDRILIDKKTNVKASEVNSIIKRKQVKGMTPSASKDYAYELYVDKAIDF